MSEERIARAIRHVSQYQLPVNEQLATRLRESLKSEQLSITAFLKEVSNDPGLYIRCIRNLLDEEPTASDPIRAMRSKEYWQLAELLNADKNTLQAHDLQKATESQQKQYLTSSLAVSTCELLAEKHGAPLTLSPEAVKSAALIRQIGYAFIAWNYPKLYEDSIIEASSGIAIDDILVKKLGYSPQLLAVKVLSSWGISPSYLASIGLYEEVAESEIVSRQISDTLVSICEVGEKLARAANPKLYPSASRDWHQVNSELRKQLGSSGYEQVVERFQQNIEEFVQLAPEVFHPALILDMITQFEVADRSISADVSLSDGISLPFQRALREFYQKLARNSSNEASLHTLLFEVTTHSVLRGGIVYTIDPFRQSFAPQVSFGSVYRSTVAECSSLITLSDGDIVASTFQHSEGYLSSLIDEDEESRIELASVIGKSHRIGVVYAECEVEAQRGMRAESDLRALAVAISTVLKLG